ncbi:MAG: hypothetical protein Q9166_000102 [cf. Caloplaca sp. 2 TL-2023]
MPRNGDVGAMQSGMVNPRLGCSGSVRGSTPVSAWETKGVTSAHKDESGWEKVSRPKPQLSEKKPLQDATGNRQYGISIIEPSKPPRSSRQPGPPSAAAQSRMSAYDRNSKQTHLATKDPNGGTKYYKGFYKSGMIIRGILHEQNFVAASSRTEFTDKSYWDSQHGSICTKYRKMIVLATYADHYTAIPLYTHNGKGLIGKKDPDEFVSIVDHREKNPGPRLSSHPPLKTKQMNESAQLLHLKSTAHITYPLSRKYDLPIVHEGCLQEGSLAHLIKLVNDATPKVLRDKHGVIVQPLIQRQAKAGS